jgi:hypothetical protein
MEQFPAWGKSCLDSRTKFHGREVAIWEDAMDGDKDDKSIIEKTIEAVKEIATIASEAAHKAMEPEPIKPGDEVVMMPMAASGFMGDTMMPPFVVVPRKKKSSKKKAPKPAAKKPAKKSVKKAANKVAKKSAKKAKSTVGRKAVGKKKTATKAAKKKKAKNPKR